MGMKKRDGHERDKALFHGDVNRTECKVFHWKRYADLKSVSKPFYGIGAAGFKI